MLVIGGGYTGLSAALHLRQKGIDVAVVEAVEIGFGASGRNVGLVNAGMWVMPEVVESVLGRPYGDRLLRLLGDAPSYVFELAAKYRIDCEIVRAGTLHCGRGSREVAELRQRHSQWAARGAPVRLLDSREVSEHTGSPAFDAALLDLRAGTIQPLAYARGLARAALEQGAKIFTQSPALSSERTPHGWTVRTPRGSVTARWVIVATDAYAEGPWNIVRAAQIHLAYFNFATAPLSAALQASILPGREGAWDARRVLSSFRMDAAGRLIFGSVGSLDGSGRRVHEAWARRALSQIYPQLAEVAFASGWFGRIGMTGDNLPKFYQLEPDVLAISGYNGRGIAPGTAMGRVIADYVSGAVSLSSLPLPVSQPVKPALRGLREWAYRAGAQATHMVSARYPLSR